MSVYSDDDIHGCLPKAMTMCLQPPCLPHTSLRPPTVHRSEGQKLAHLLHLANWHNVWMHVWHCWCLSRGRRGKKRCYGCFCQRVWHRLALFQTAFLGVVKRSTSASMSASAALMRWSKFAFNSGLAQRLPTVSAFCKTRRAEMACGVRLHRSEVAPVQRLSDGVVPIGTMHKSQGCVKPLISY